MTTGGSAGGGGALPRAPRRAGPRGFSLLESVIASTILLSGIAILTSSIGSVSKIDQRQRAVTAVIHAAESLTEELLLRLQTDPALAIGGPYPGPSYDNDMNRNAAGPVTTSYRVGAGPVAGIKRIQVTATAPGPVGAETVEIVSYRR